MKKALLLTAAALGIAAAAVGGVSADRRAYLVTYGYYTPVKGEVELEQWTDSFTDRNGDTSYRSKTEFEYGVTDRFAAALYLVNKRPVGGPWDYSETKLEMRYRITEPGNRFWDTAGYLELVRPADSEDPYKMESKAIFSHQFPKFNLTFNLQAEKGLEPDAEIEFGYALGVAPYHQSRLGYTMEMFGGEGEHYVMPALWLPPGMGQNAGIGLAIGLTDDSDRLQVRTMYSREF